MNGIILLDKPAGISSAGAVNSVKRVLPRKTKIGHAGTLDPFATGLLVLLVGNATKRCEALMDQPKQYEATVRFGATTDTDDPESPPQPAAGASPPTTELVREALNRIIGNIEQLRPQYRDLKIAGKRACDRVRQGENIELKPRIVRIYDVALL